MGIDHYNTGCTTANIIISNNLITKSVHSGLGGISLRAPTSPIATDIVINNNTIVNGLGYGLYLDTNYSGVTVQLNHLHGNAVSATNLTVAQKAAHNWFNNQPQDVSSIIQLGTTSIYSGSGVPAGTLGANGDIYFNTAGGAGTTMYQKRAGAWVATAA